MKSQNHNDWDPKIIILIVLNGSVWYCKAVMHPKEADGMTDNVDSDQVDP